MLEQPGVQTPGVENVPAGRVVAGVGGIGVRTTYFVAGPEIGEANNARRFRSGWSLSRAECFLLAFGIAGRRLPRGTGGGCLRSVSRLLRLLPPVLRPCSFSFSCLPFFVFVFVFPVSSLVFLPQQLAKGQGGQGPGDFETPAPPVAPELLPGVPDVLVVVVVVCFAVVPPVVPAPDRAPGRTKLVEFDGVAADLETHDAEADRRQKPERLVVVVGGRGKHDVAAAGGVRGGIQEVIGRFLQESGGCFSGHRHRWWALVSDGGGNLVRSMVAPVCFGRRCLLGLEIGNRKSLPCCVCEN